MTRPCWPSCTQRREGRRSSSTRASTCGFSDLNPLIGHGHADRFVPLTKAYDEALLAQLHAAARGAEVELNEGVYMWFSRSEPADRPWPRGPFRAADEGL